VKTYQHLKKGSAPTSYLVNLSVSQSASHSISQSFVS